MCTDIAHCLFVARTFSAPSGAHALRSLALRVQAPALAVRCRDFGIYMAALDLFVGQATSTAPPASPAAAGTATPAPASGASSELREAAAALLSTAWTAPQRKELVPWVLGWLAPHFEGPLGAQKPREAVECFDKNQVSPAVPHEAINEYLKLHLWSRKQASKVMYGFWKSIALQCASFLRMCSPSSPYDDGFSTHEFRRYRVNYAFLL